MRRYTDKRDREITGFIASALALGRADLIRRAVDDLLERMECTPYRFVSAFDPHEDSAIFDGFVYRFYSGRDITLLIWWIKQMYEEAGSIEDFFMRGYRAPDKDIGPALSRFVRSILRLETLPVYAELPEKGSGIRHFLADPVDGSGCKRLNLFLRWMVRLDSVDLGLWPRIPASKLVIPLDTHIERMGKRLGLTKRGSASWQMALEITEALRGLDPDDPVKYDFALCTIGKNHPCPPGNADITLCQCPLQPHCRGCREHALNS